MNTKIRTEAMRVVCLVVVLLLVRTSAFIWISGGGSGICSCVHGHCGYHGCHCFPGYMGQHCDQVDPCVSHPCHNDGHCQHQNSGYSCTCQAGFTGPTCQVDACAPNPCQNSGKCTHLLQSPHYQCDCSNGYHGYNCENSPAQTTVPTTTTMELTTLPAAYNECDKLTTVTQIADEATVELSGVTRCPSGTYTSSEAFVQVHCVVSPPMGWIPGANVGDHCNQIPLYTPVATFSSTGHYDGNYDRSGIFVGCLSDGFRLAYQKCDTAANITHIMTGGTGNDNPRAFFTIQ